MPIRSGACNLNSMDHEFAFSKRPHSVVSMPIGPSLPPRAPVNTEPQTPSYCYLKEVANEEDEDEPYAPALPPDMLPSARSAPASTPKPIKGPIFSSVPSLPPHNTYDDGVDDDDYGPMPLPESALVSHDGGGDGVRQFLELEERRNKSLEVG